MIREMIATLQNEGSKNGKIAILKTADLIFQEVLRFAYNPEFNYYIKAVRKPANYGSQTLYELWPQVGSLLMTDTFDAGSWMPVPVSLCHFGFTTSHVSPGSLSYGC